MLGNWKTWFADAPVDTGANLARISLEYSKEELARATKGFNQSEVLGSGNYGAVYRGVMRDGSQVAIKLMEVDEKSSSDSGFVDEVKCLSKFRHPNLVTLMGWCRDQGQRFIVYELLVGGDVSKRLKDVACGEDFDWSERLSIALDAASGLSHMHNSTPKAFHRDIKSANILLDRNGTAKMADFGLSLINKRSNEQLYMTVEHISGTPGYACPHYIKTGRITEQTEVFAFGMVMLELFMNMAPACMGQNGCILYPIFQTIMPQVDGVRMRVLNACDPEAKWPPAIAGGLVDLALVCTSIEEARRPDFIGVLQTLRPMCEQHLGHGRRRASGSERVGMHSAGSPLLQAQSESSSRSTAPPRGAGYDEPTRPQLGLSCSPSMEGGETYSQLGVRCPPGSSSNQPQSHTLVPATSGPSHLGYETRAACPKSAVRSGSQKICVLADPSSLEPALDLAEVVLNCTYAVGIDVALLPDRHRCHTFKLGEMGPPWSLGRQQQPQLFGRLVKDDALRSCISRSHLELKWEPPRLLLKKLSPNMLLLNGQAVPPSFVPLNQGAQLAFCPAASADASGASVNAPFLVFTVYLRDAATVAAVGPTALPTRPDLPVPEHIVKEMQLRQQQQQQQVQPLQQPRALLACNMALDPNHGERNLESMSPELKSIPIPSDGRIVVGRQCQQGFFEGLLGSDSIFLTFISRQHFELVESPNDHGVFNVTNLSANPLVVNGLQVEKGQSRQVRLPGSIDFIAKAMSAAESQVFLRLHVVEDGRASLPLASATGIRTSREVLFWLEIGGTACKVEFLPTARSRRVMSTEAALNVGRSHQGPLFSEALKDGVMQFLSRDHFRIERTPHGGQFQLVPLSANPMWRERSGVRDDAIKGHSMMLELGDKILIFTGASDRTPDGPGGQGSLFLVFGNAQMTQGQSEMDLHAANA